MRQGKYSVHGCILGPGSAQFLSPPLFAHVLILWKFSVTDTKTGCHRVHGIDRFFLFFFDRFFLFLQRHSTRSEGQSFATGESVNCHYLLFQPEQGVQCPSAWIQPLKGPSHTISLPPILIPDWLFRCRVQDGYLLNYEMLLYDQLQLATDFQPCWRETSRSRSVDALRLNIIAFIARFKRAGRFPANPSFWRLAA